jgi:Uri superfamily endonuclease
MNNPRALSKKEKEHLMRVAIGNRDKALLKRIKKNLVKDNEYRWHIKQNKQ